MRSNGQFVAYDINHDYFKSMYGRKYWLIGLLAADGSVASNGKQVSISQSGKEGKKIIQYIKKELGFKGKIYKYKNAYTIQFTSIKIINFLKRFNIVNRKTLKYELPEQLLGDPTQLRNFRDFFRGYFYGDGSIGVYDNGKGVNYLCCSVVGTKEFIERAHLYIPEEGNIRKIKNCKNLYEIRWNGQKARNFTNWLYSNETLLKTYKYKIYLSNKKETYRYDVSTKPKQITIELSKKGKSPQEIFDFLKTKGYNTKKTTIYNWRYKYV